MEKIKMKNFKLSALTLLGLMVSVCSVTPAFAGYTYTYTGNIFNAANASWNGSNQITGNFSVNSVLGNGSYNMIASPQQGFSFNFINGLFTNFNIPSNAIQNLSDSFNVTISNGNITSWDIFLVTTNATEQIVYATSTGLDSAGLTSLSSATYLGGASGNPGAWAVAAVPEPGEWILLLSGFGLVGFMARRKNCVS